MQKGSFRDNIDKLVRLLPRPMMNGKLIDKSRNSWLIVEEYGQADGIVVLNKITNHGGQIPYDSIREWREPDKVILSAQVNVGKDGFFEITPFLDGPETEMQTEDEEILPERLSFARVALELCTPEQCMGIKQLLIREKMSDREMNDFCTLHGIPNGYKFFSHVNGRTSFLDKEGDGHTYQMWVKPGFVPILSKLLLDSQSQLPPTQPG